MLWDTLVQGYTVDGKAAREETTFSPSEGIAAHATEHIRPVALEAQQMSDTSQDRSLEAASLSGIIPCFSASASNSAAPPLASESAHSVAILCATGEVVATLA